METIRTEFELDQDRSEQLKLAKAAFLNLQNNITSQNPWANENVDKLEAPDHDEFKEVVQACKFFYRHDPLASTVINKIVDIGIGDLVIEKSNLSDNEVRIFEALIPKLRDFAEDMAEEYLLSGLVIPEIQYARITSADVKRLGVKKKETLTLPQVMWLRDPASIKINTSMITNQPSYFVEVPDDLAFFINSKGTYPDGTKDQELYEMLATFYPDFVRKVQEGEKEILIEARLAFRRRALTDSPYPVSYLYSAIEALKHKRNLRRMDYSIASRVISGILLTKMGNDEYPLLENDEEQFDDLKNQMHWRNTANRDVERVFQLFANHTVEMEWVFPPVEALLDDSKYSNVNMDIIWSLGLPQILITGETTRSGTSNSEMAMVSPQKTLETVRRKVLEVINDIVYDVIQKNNLRGTARMRFTPLNLVGFRDFVTGLVELYNSGNLSRDSYADVFGFEFEEEMHQKAQDKELMDELGVEEFAMQPFSPQPGNNNNRQSEVQNE